ncbi:MAG: helix-turn-helix domain-containing protein [Acetobacteraceae bacterium]
MVISNVAVEPGSAPPTALPQHVKRALAYLRANMASKVTLAELATACGISQRALLNQFERFLGVSPIAHLRRMRLAAARDELRQSDGTVSISEVASGCGFTHLARFAAEYRKAFGELPSATLRRAVGSTDKGNVGNDCRASVPSPFVARQRPSLIILPLRTETIQERHIAQELMEQLAASISRTSVASVTFADPTMVLSRRTVRSPREPVTAEYCLNGRLVQRDGGIRVTLWLVDTEGRHVWGDSYDGTSCSVFDLLQRIVDGAVCGVVPGIGGAEIARIHRKDPEALAAREMILRAFPILLKIDWDSTRKVFAIASRAMEMDPDDALPVAVAAYCQARLFNDAATASPVATRGLAHHLTRRAGALDAGDPLVTTARAAVAALSGSHDDAETLVDRALAMDPTSGWAWERKGFLLWCNEPDVAIGCFNRALRLHGPFMPRDNCFLGIAQAHAAADRFDEAARWARRATAENPRAATPKRVLICYEDKSGRHFAARQMAGQLCREHPEVSVSRLEQVHPDWCFSDLLRAGVTP